MNAKIALSTTEIEKAITQYLERAGWDAARIVLKAEVFRENYGGNVTTVTATAEVTPKKVTSYGSGCDMRPGH
jgi:hypothetical protein